MKIKNHNHHQKARVLHKIKTMLKKKAKSKGENLSRTLFRLRSNYNKLNFPFHRRKPIRQLLMVLNFIATFWYYFYFHNTWDRKFKMNIRSSIYKLKKNDVQKNVNNRKYTICGVTVNNNVKQQKWTMKRYNK